LAMQAGFFSLSSSELLLEVVNEDGRTTRSTRSEANDRDGLMVGWPKTSRRGTTSSGTVKLKGRRGLAMATPREGFPFIPQQKHNSHPNWLR
jgi:hypothetical protein